MSERMKVVFEFTKTGNMIFISHLDLTRLFLRVLRMSGLRPEYSQGFNPHPKMSFALPLAVGIHSVCELLEFETDRNISIDEVREAAEKANERLPEGVRVTSAREKPESLSRPLASYVSAAGYEFMCEGIVKAPGLLEDFFGRESVIVKKTDKKTRTETEKDVRADMLDYTIIKDMRGRMLAGVTLSAKPGQTLNPAVFFDAFCNASGIAREALSPVITRTSILDAGGKALREMLE